MTTRFLGAIQQDVTLRPDHCHYFWTSRCHHCCRHHACDRHRCCPNGQQWIATRFERVIFFFVAFFATSYVGAVAILPAALVIVISEAARMRSFLYYGVGGALVALASYYGSDISVQLENTTDVTPVANALQLAAAAGNPWRPGILADRRPQRRPLARASRRLAPGPIQRGFESVVAPEQLAADGDETR